MQTFLPNGRLSLVFFIDQFVGFFFRPIACEHLAIKKCSPPGNFAKIRLLSQKFPDWYRINCLFLRHSEHKTLNFLKRGTIQ